MDTGTFRKLEGDGGPDGLVLAKSAKTNGSDGKKGWHSHSGVYDMRVTVSDTQQSCSLKNYQKCHPLPETEDAGTLPTVLDQKKTEKQTLVVTWVTGINSGIKAVRRNQNRVLPWPPFQEATLQVTRTSVCLAGNIRESIEALEEEDVEEECSELTSLRIRAPVNLTANTQESCYNIPGAVSEYQHESMNHLISTKANAGEKSTANCSTQTCVEDHSPPEFRSLTNGSQKPVVDVSTQTNTAVQNKQLTEKEARTVFRKSMRYLKENMDSENTVDNLMVKGELFFNELDAKEMVESSQKFTSKDANRNIMNILLKPRSNQLEFYEYVKDCFKETGQHNIVKHLEKNEEFLINNRKAKDEKQPQNGLNNATNGDQENASYYCSMSKVRGESETQGFFENLNLPDVPAEHQLGRTRRSVVHMPESIKQQTYM